MPQPKRVGKNILGIGKLTRRVQGNLARKREMESVAGVEAHSRMRSRFVDKKRMAHELQGIQRIFDHEVRGRSHGELSAIYLRVYRGIYEGNIRGLNTPEIQRYFATWFKELVQQSPEFAQKLNVQKHGSMDRAIMTESAKAAWTFMRSLSQKGRKALNERMRNLAILAKGGTIGE